MDQAKFLEVKIKLIAVQREQNGVGTLSEKSVHAVLKEYFAQSPDQCEQKIGRFVADIFTGEEIIEIQTKAFDKMRRKLAFFLPKYPVTIVHPIPHIKTIRWIDPKTGETSKPRRSPITGNIYMIFEEMYKIKPFITNANFSVCVMLIDMDEYKVLDGFGKDRKRRATKVDKIPTTLISETLLHSFEDYAKLIPKDLADGFLVKDFGKACGISKQLAGVCLNVLFSMGVVDRVSKQGNAFVYARSTEKVFKTDENTACVQS